MILRRAIADLRRRDWSSVAIMVPQMEPIRCGPRFVAVVAKLKTSDPRHATVCGGKS